MFFFDGVKLVELFGRLKSHSDLNIQLLVDYSSANQEHFNSIQEFCVVELKMQLIPVGSPKDIVQYLECFVSERDFSSYHNNNKKKLN